MLAELRYYFGLRNPKKYSDKALLKMYKELEYVRQKEANNMNTLLSVNDNGRVL